jgi:hypothetical protein
MVKTLLFFMIVSFGFAQTKSETESVQPVKSDSISVSQDIGLLGYQFHSGQMAIIPISEGFYLQTGILELGHSDLQVVEMPIIFKKKIAKDFYAFFGAKLNAVTNLGILSLNRPPTSRDYGASLEMGIQYDVNDRMMLELRYSVPVIKNQGVYPSVPNINNTPYLRLGTGFKF